MRQRVLIGIILLLSSIFYSCVKVEPDYIDGHLKYINFGIGETKAVRSFNWERNDKVCIYSLVDGYITYKDTVTISNANGNTCKIKALVDVNSTQYFATYPFNAIKSEVGERLNDEALRVVYDGTYRGTSIMTCYAPANATDLWFEQRLSLLQITNIIGSVNGSVSINSSLPVEHNFKMNGGGNYFIPISHKNEEVTITFKTTNWKRTKTMKVEPGKIYVSQYTVN